jgi:hypothetical protein
MEIENQAIDLNKLTNLPPVTFTSIKESIKKKLVRFLIRKIQKIN